MLRTLCKDIRQGLYTLTANWQLANAVSMQDIYGKILLRCGASHGLRWQVGHWSRACSQLPLLAPSCYGLAGHTIPVLILLRLRLPFPSTRHWTHGCSNRHASLTAAVLSRMRRQKSRSWSATTARVIASWASTSANRGTGWARAARGTRMRTRVRPVAAGVPAKTGRGRGSCGISRAQALRQIRQSS